MRNYLIPESGRFYKANLHTHSTLSDGKLTPAELKKAYKSAGYSILSITDHEILLDHSDLNDSDFLTITGYELYNNEPGKHWLQAKTCHLNFYAREAHNVTQVCFNPKYLFSNAVSSASSIRYSGPLFEREYSPVGVNKMIREAVKHGFFVSYNHPAWSLENYNDYTRYKGMFAMEIYNNTSTCDGNGDSHNENIYDDMLRAGKHIFALAGDDAHVVTPPGQPGCDLFGGWIMVKAPELSYDAVVNALLSGAFYASCGPEIQELYTENGKAFLRCSPVRDIRFVTSGRHAAFFRGTESEPLTSAEVAFSEADGYFRLEITDFNGRKAYTNPCFLTKEV